MKFKAKDISYAALIAALYVILTFLSSLAGLASGPVQIRFSEALCILPCFTPAAVPGLFIGCILSNLLTGGVIVDVLFGSLATLLAALGTRALRKRRFLASLSPVVLNTLVIPPVLIYAYGIPSGYWIVAAGVAAGEFVSAGLLGQLLYELLQKRIIKGRTK